MIDEKTIKRIVLTGLLVYFLALIIIGSIR